MGDADRGMKLLPKKTREAHPRAQVQSLQRIATRSLTKADRMDQHRAEFEELQTEEALAAYSALRRKAEDAAAAMARLNADHDLGYQA